MSIILFLLSRGADVNTPGVNGYRALHAASWVGQTEVVKFLITQNASINAIIPDGATALSQAANYSQHDVVQILLSHGADASIGDHNGRLPIHNAVTKKSIRCVQLLLDDDVGIHTINKLTHAGWFPLMEAAYNGDFELVSLLVERGAEVNIIANWGRTPLFCAANQGHMKVFNLLFNKCPRVAEMINKVTEWSGTSLLITAVQGKSLEIVQKLVENGADLSKVDYRSRSPLDWAIYQGSADIVQLLLANGAVVSPKDPVYEGWEPLHYSCEAGFVDLAKMLLARGADAGARTGEDGTALHIAAGNGHLGVVELLLVDPAGAQTLNVASDDGYVPIMTACENGHVEIASFLIDQGADVTTKNDRGFNVLSLAALSGSIAMVTLLLDKCGAEAFSGDFVLHGAAEAGEFEVFELVKQYYKLNTLVYDSGMSILHCAASGGSLDIVRIVLDEGDPALLCQKSYDDSTPLQLALENGNVDVARMLLDRYAEQSPPIKLESDDAFAAVESSDLDVLKLLFQIDERVCLSAKIDDNVTLLMSACRLGYHNTMDYLLTKGFKILDKNGWGTTCLSSYACNGHSSTARFFNDIDWDTALNVRSLDGFTPILYSCLFGQSDPFRRFVLHGASVRDRVKTGWPISAWSVEQASTMHLVASTASIEVAKIIFDTCGSECLQWRDQSGAYPAHYSAAWNDSDYMLEWLHEKGADLSVRTHAGDSVLMLAVARDCRASAGYLIKQGMTPTDRKERIRLLAYASANGGPYVLKLLLKNGFRLEEMELQGLIPLHMAASEGYVTTIQWLLEQGNSWDSKDDHGWTPRDCLKLAKSEDLEDFLKAELPREPSTWLKPTQWCFDSTVADDFAPGADKTVARLHIQPRSDSSNECRSPLRGLTADHYLVPTRETSYFEVAIIECPPTNGIGIGLDGLIGEWKTSGSYFSCLYFGDFGSFMPYIYNEDCFAEPYGQGDTIGCGVDYEAQTIFFTKNGACVGVATDEFGARASPAIYTVEDTLEVHANFGQRPFMFDIANHDYGKKDCAKCYKPNLQVRVRYADYKLWWEETQARKESTDVVMSD